MRLHASQFGSWVALICLLAKQEQQNSSYFTLGLIGLSLNYALNAADMVVFIRIYRKSEELKQWLRNKRNRRVCLAVRIAAALTNFNVFKIIHSRFFGFSFFSAVYVQPEHLFSSNVLHGLSVLLIQIPFIISAGLTAYSQKSQQ